MPNSFLKPLKISFAPPLHIPALDGLRGIAIIMVLLYHCFFPLWKFGASAGWVGVDLFFVLSGFLITGILLDSRKSKTYFKTFYLRRSLRIFPLYYLFLICFFLISPFFIAPGKLWPYQYYFDHQIWYWFYAPNWLITFDNHWPPVPKPLLDHFWSLAIEEQFYLLWPLLVFVFNRRALILICLVLIFQSIIIRNIFENIGKDYSSSYVFTFARLDAISIGALIAIMLRSEIGKGFLEKHTLKVLLGSFVTLVLLTLFTHTFNLKNEYFIRIGYTVIGLFFGAYMVWAMATGSVANTISDNKFFKFFGKYSYGIYIYHWLVSPLLTDQLGKYFSQFTSRSPWLLASFITVLIIIVMSVISFHLFEKQFLKLKRFVNY